MPVETGVATGPEKIYLILLQSLIVITMQQIPSSPKYILLRQKLPSTFSQQHWQEILKQSQESSQKLQQKILGILLTHEDLFNTYFHTFYTNHLTLFHWCLLARENHLQIKNYVFARLIAKPEDKYVQEVKAKWKEKQSVRCCSKQKEGGTHSQCPPKKKMQQLSNQIFHFMKTKNKTASLINQPKTHSFHSQNSKKIQKSPSTTQADPKIINHPFSAKQRSSEAGEGKQNSQGSKVQTLQNIQNNSKMKVVEITEPSSPGKFKNRKPNYDFHDLFVKTFHACDGFRYIFYNYEKHQKGINEKDKYNNFIRSQSKAKIADLRLTQSSEQSPLYMQFSKDKDSTANTIRSSYQFSSYGNAVTNKSQTYKSRVVLKRIKSQNVGVFIRK